MKYLYTIIIVACLLSQDATSQTSVFVKFGTANGVDLNDGDAKLLGNTTYTSMNGWNSLEGFSSGFTNPALVGSEGIIAGRASFEVATLNMSLSSPVYSELMTLATTGNLIDSVEVHYFRIGTGGDSGLTFRKTTFYKVAVANVELGGDNIQDALTVTLIYEAVRREYTKLKVDGTEEAPVSTEWNQVTNSP